ncbi:hypothetical protein EVA_21531, partial [gut metagenome]
YGDYPSQEDLCTHRYEESIGFCHPQYVGTETEYEAEGTAESGTGKGCR